MNDEISFAVISHPVKATADESTLQDAIEHTDEENLAFVVVNGMKAANEPCTDKIYLQRKALLEAAKNGLIVSLAASDWAVCKNENGRSAAIAKLNRVRELFFGDEFSIGATKIPVIRQSMTVKHRSFAENARWEIDDTLFATINIPANNNHYVSDAGRNSEFEDRVVANNDWLYRIFTSATRKKMKAIVLFSDGNPLGAFRPRTAKRDGYLEVRKQITTVAAKFPGKVLLVHGDSARASASPAIRWQGNIGEISVGSGWLKISVNHKGAPAFKVSRKHAGMAESH
ncbi:MAG TPA: hypothetical protein VFF81_04540 [Noviherbaspirillum sp.]|nr:hypothetical protein [Noviherbaspirillum sp.]